MEIFWGKPSILQQKHMFDLNNIPVLFRSGIWHNFVKTVTFRPKHGKMGQNPILRIQDWKEEIG